MAYSKQQWNDGDIITANKLNHMEDGISEAGGSVQKIKLGTANGGGASVEGGISFSGGFALPNGTTVYDLIGNKIVIGFSGEFDQESTGGNQHTEYVTNLNVWVQQDSSMTTGDIRTATAEERATFTGFVVHGIVPNRTAGALAMDIYAICI